MSSFIGLATTAAAVPLAVFLWRKLRCSLNAKIDGLSDLAAFDCQEVLVESSDGFTVLLGRFAWQPAGERSLVKIRATSVSGTAIVSSLVTHLSSYSGAEYAYYKGTTSLVSLLSSQRLRPSFAVEVIAPANDKQIARSRPQPGVFVIEPPSLYHSVVAPYIDGLDPAATAWIYKCLDLSKERERVLFNDPNPETGFLLNVDTKWKSHPRCVEAAEARATWKHHESVKDLYCLAICHRRDIRSLRDLNASHLPLLRHILSTGVRTVCETYGVVPTDLRVFVHYQPQFYHFHVHFTRLHSDLGCQVERAHLLHEIIETLEREGKAYSHIKTLYYQLKENDKLLAKIRAAGGGGEAAMMSAGAGAGVNAAGAAAPAPSRKQASPASRK